MTLAFWLASALSVAHAVEFSAGPMLEDGYRPGARVGAHWELQTSARQRNNGDTTQHVLSGGPDLATYVVPGIHWSVLPGATVAWRRSGARGLRLEADLGASLVVQKTLAPTYRIEEGELEEVRMAGRLKWAPTARVGIGLAPTHPRSWGVVFRPSVFVESRQNGMRAPILANELALTWGL